VHAIGRYRLVEQIGRGGMGEVWRAQAPDGREVALKLLLAGRGAGPDQRRRFGTEVRTQLRLRHPNLVALLDAGETDAGVPFLVLEWVPGETLAARLAREGPLHPRDAVELVRRLALALAHCHGQGVLHRDLKPENVLLRAGDGEPLLTDFGLARDLDVSLATRSGVSLGTPGWWSPEQAFGQTGAVGPRSDVYGLGALLYAALTGCGP
jgi:serine/threonine-protein kinase